jgi:hypothetical protein
MRSLLVLLLVVALSSCKGIIQHGDLPPDAGPTARQTLQDAGVDAIVVPMDGHDVEGPFPMVDAAFDAIQTRTRPSADKK